MSYKHVILNSHPSSFYMLDEVASPSIVDYNELKLIYPTYQDLKDNGISYSYITGTPVYDYSGNKNDGVAIQANTSNILPLVPGSIKGTEVKDQTSIRYTTNGFANIGYKNNAFSIDFWFRPPLSSNSEIPLVADINNSIGVYYNNGFIYFKLLGKQCAAKIENHKSHYVTAVYTSDSILLYIDGILISTSQVEQYLYFQNLNTNFQTGPSSTTDSFIIDCVAFYRYALSLNQINNHYVAGNYEVDYGQVVYPENGVLFSLNSSKLNVIKKYNYPYTKKWTELLSGDGILSADQSYITFKQTAETAQAEFSFIEEMFVPDNITGSFLSYSPNIENIIVEISQNGISNWIPCKNYSSLPLFNKETYDGESRIFIKTTMTSEDTSFDLPKLKNLYVDFYSDTNYYADNSGDFISSTFDYNMSQYNERLLSQNRYNGLQMNNGGGFDANINSKVRTIELIYTPGKEENILFKSQNSLFKWNQLGAITKNGISGIYVNGIDVTNETNVFNYFSPDIPHYVAITLLEDIETVIQFNYDGVSYGLGSTFSNLSLIHI